jgi:GT2 family glycosyltransferase
VRIAVLIVNWNSRPLLERCLSALDRQTRSPDRTIVIDNGSERGSLEGLTHNPSVEIIRLPENEGFARANNLGVAAAADCEWVALLNPDAFPEPGWLAALERAAKTAGPECVSFASQMKMAERPDRLDGAGDAYHISGLAWRRGHGQAVSDAAQQSREVFSACAAAALYRRDAFVETGGFDSSYFCYAEDVDLGFRLRLAGHRIIYVPDAIVLHVGSATSGANRDFLVYHGHRNLVWTYVKNMPASMFWIYLPQHVALNVISLAWFTFRGQSRAIWRAKWDTLKGLPRMWRERRRIQASRRVETPAIRRVMARGLLTPYREHLERDT